MLTLGQIAAAMGTYASGGAGESLVSVNRGTARLSDNAIPAGAIAISIVAMLVFLAVVIAILWLLGGRARRRERLIELAMKNNQPEIAQQLIEKKSGFWRVVLWIILAVAALNLLSSAPMLVFIGAGLILLYMTLGSERRGHILRGAAARTGDVQEWLAKKADDNKPKDVPNSDPNRYNDNRDQGHGV